MFWKKKNKTKEKLNIKTWIKNKRNKKKIVFFGTLFTVGTWLFWGIPFPTKLATYNFPVSTKIFDRRYVARILFFRIRRTFNEND